MRRASVIGSGCFVLSLAAGAAAHPVVVDGDASEWLERQPASRDLGMIARAADGSGELVWRDATGDARTTVSGAGPETFADLTALQVTADEDNLYFLARGLFYQPVTPPQLQIAIDLDQVPGAGEPLFVGASDTSVRTDAEWEFLVQTRFKGAGALAQSAVLWSGGSVVEPALAVHFDGYEDGLVEVAVPWDALGLAGPPATPIRLSVAVFREKSDGSHDTYEGSGADALDVVSDYGDPGIGASPGTGAEFVSNNELTDTLDVFFAPDGEVRAPVRIDRVMPLAPAGGSRWWVTIQSQLGYGYPRGGLKLGDASSPDSGSSGMRVMPAGTLGAGARLTFASNAADFQAVLGHLPDVEQGDGSPSVPAAAAYTVWSAQAVNLGTNDAVLLLDDTNTILDAVSWGSALPAAVTTALPTPAQDSVFVRTADTDDCVADFAAAPQCTGGGTCDVCRSCTADACLPKAPNASCTDGDACNGVELCDGLGSCAAGQPPDCDDGNACTDDACSPALGCENEPATGADCSDGSACTEDDVCDANGQCAGSAVQCVAPGPSCLDASTSRSWSGGACEPDGSCSFDSTDTICDFGCDAGTGLCDGDPCEEVSCKAPPGDCFALEGVCVAGECQYEPTPGVLCDDADDCTTGDVCDAAGQCAGEPLRCSSPPEPFCATEEKSIAYAAPGSCNKGACSYEELSEECPEGCDAATGRCAGDLCAGVLCPPSDNPCEESEGLCKEGFCAYQPVPPGTGCDDGDEATEGDACDGSGACVGTPVDPGTGGSGAGGGVGTGGAGTGGSGSGGGATGGAAETGGATATGGTSDTGGATATGGTSDTGGASDTGGTSDTGGGGDLGGEGPVATGGAEGGEGPSGGTSGTGGASATGGDPDDEPAGGEAPAEPGVTLPRSGDAGGCSVTAPASGGGASWLWLLGLALPLVRRRSRR